MGDMEKGLFFKKSDEAHTEICRMIQVYNYLIWEYQITAVRSCQYSSRNIPLNKYDDEDLNV